MIYILQGVFLFVLLLRWRGSNNCYKILVLFQVVSFAAAPLVANFVIFDTPLTYFNIFYCLLNLFLIISPWRKTKFDTLEIEDSSFFTFYEKILYIVLGFTIINNLIVLICVRLFIPEIAVFKAQKGYKSLYDTIPYFGILFRYTSVSRYLGLLALPICAYYIQKQSYKQAAKAFILSLSSFIAAIAHYSRAQMLSYIFICICLYFYVENIFISRISRLVRRAIKYLALAVAVIFTALTVSRFSSPVMSYYGNRIPEASYIKSPVLYSVIDYISMGFPNGINQLELHESKDVLKGEPLIYDFMMMLSYFGLTSWTTEEFNQRFDDAYNKNGLNRNNNSSAFHGYTCATVKMVGYVLTLLLSMVYYFYVRRKSVLGRISIRTLSILLFLLLISIESIYYSDYAVALYPLLFYLILFISHTIIHRRVVIRSSKKTSHFRI